MTQQTIVALFRTREQAETAQHQLEAAGIPATDIMLRDGPVETAAATRSDGAERHSGFWEWLFGAHPSAADVERYRSHAAQGGAALSVRAEGRDTDRIAELLEQHDLVAIEGATEYEGASERTGTAPQAAGVAEESTLPTAHEELEIGKRQVSSAKTYRIRRYVVERPAEEQVALHDERVEIERRAAPGAERGAAPFEERTIEVTETHEEPVVSKRVVPGEEVVVRKYGEDRVETVRGTVRESRVEVDRAAAGDKPSIKEEPARSTDAPPTGGTR